MYRFYVSTRSSLSDKNWARLQEYSLSCSMDEIFLIVPLNTGTECTLRVCILTQPAFPYHLSSQRHAKIVVIWACPLYVCCLLTCCRSFIPGHCLSLTWRCCAIILWTNTPTPCVCLLGRQQCSSSPRWRLWRWWQLGTPPQPSCMSWTLKQGWRLLFNITLSYHLC